MQKFWTVELFDSEGKPSGLFEKLTDMEARALVNSRRARYAMIPVKLKGLYGPFNVGEQVGLKVEIAEDLFRRGIAVPAEPPKKGLVVDAPPAEPGSLSGMSVREASDKIDATFDVELLEKWAAGEERKSLKKALAKRIEALSAEGE